MLSPTLPTAMKWLGRNPKALLPRNAQRAAGLILRATATSLAGHLGPEVPKGPAPDPVFIVGFWRSGTTWLHEMLALDPATAYLTCYDCMASTHAHWTAGAAMPHLRSRFVSRRPMDAMELRLDSPMEDEFYLLNQGLPSFYELFLFPEEGANHFRALDPEAFTPSEREAWLRSLHRLLGGLSRRDAARALLKSPTHGFRIPFLLRHFPRARFIHIDRDPVEVFLSTRHTWLVNARLFAMDPAGVPEDFSDLALAAYRRYRASLDSARATADPSRWVDLRYEDLRADPSHALARIYEAFGWTGFERLAPAVKADLEARSGFRGNAFHAPPEEAAALRRLLTA